MACHPLPHQIVPNSLRRHHVPSPALPLTFVMLACPAVSLPVSCSMLRRLEMPYKGALKGALSHHAPSPALPLTFVILACPAVSLPVSCSVLSRHTISTMAWMLPSMRTSFSWFSWKAARGVPNCWRSFRYLHRERRGERGGWRSEGKMAGRRIRLE